MLRPGAGVTAPVVIKEFKPKYRADAMRAKIQGSVLLQAVVQADGTVGEVRVKRSLDREYASRCLETAKCRQDHLTTKDKPTDRTRESPH